MYSLEVFNNITTSEWCGTNTTLYFLRNLHVLSVLHGPCKSKYTDECSWFQLWSGSLNSQLCSNWQVATRTTRLSRMMKRSSKQDSMPCSKSVLHLTSYFPYPLYFMRKISTELRKERGVFLVATQQYLKSIVLFPRQPKSNFGLFGLPRKWKSIHYVSHTTFHYRPLNGLA